MLLTLRREWRILFQQQKEWVIKEFTFMKRKKRKCISTLLFQKGEGILIRWLISSVMKSFSYKEKKESHYISNSRMARFSHFLPNELFTDSARGQFYTLSTLGQCSQRGVCSFMRLFPEFYIFSSFILWKQWCAPPQRGMEIQSSYIYSLWSKSNGWVNICKDANYSICENRQNR